MLIYHFHIVAHFCRFENMSHINKQFSGQILGSGIAYYGNLRRLYLFIRSASEKNSKEKSVSFVISSLHLKYMYESEAYPVYIKIFNIE